MSNDDRTASNLVTSENLAEFTAQKLGLADPEPVEAVDSAEESTTEPQVVEEQSESVEPESEAPPPQEERKQNPKIERRFSEITKQREAAREEARREREAREALESRLKELEAKVAPPKAETVEAEPEPKPEQFSDAFEYAKALAEYTADKKLAERDRQEAERKASEERQRAIEAWANRVNAAKAEMPDFEDMVRSSDVTISDHVRDAIMESDVGPKILYHLAENNDFAKKLQGMSVVSALREIGKLEARFEKQAEPQPKVAVAKSKAPAPISPIRATSNGKDVAVDSDGNYHGSYQAWKAARMAGRIR
jgi:hypothetical protein